MNKRTTSKTNYGSFNNRNELYASDSLINYIPVSSEDKNENEFANSITTNNQKDDEFVSKSTDLILSRAPFRCTYIIEPVAFIQNLASCIMGFSVGQFIYNRILNRLIEEANNSIIPSNFSNLTLFRYNHLFYITDSSNSSSDNIPDNSDICSNQSYVPDEPSKNISSFVTSNLFYNNFNLYANKLDSFGSFVVSNTSNPSDMKNIIIKAQEESANLYFMCALFAGIPVILTTNILGVNCSKLGRKTLMVIYLLALTIRYFILMLQCVYPGLPDYLFYVGSLIDGLSGSGGVYYLAMCCYISDITRPSTRSYRIALLSNLNSMANLCVTFICGYVIKYYGYFFPFLASNILNVIALFYTILFIPETQIDLENKTLWTRLKSCSIKNTLNCIKVYFSNNTTGSKSEETETLINEETVVIEPPKQTCVLFSIVFANFVYNFGTIGISSIFTLYIMNKPFCFDSIDISNYTIFATVVSLVASLFVSKFIKVNDLLICIASVGSYFASVFCYIYGSNWHFIYLGSLVQSICSLEFGYVRSIVSKSMTKTEVSDAFSLMLIVDTFVSVLAAILFPIIYSKMVAGGLTNLFIFSNGFILIALLFHV
jgi:hypothetical protein